MRDWSGQVAVITGGASGIGFSMARRFARAGMKIVLADIEESALKEAVAALEREGAEAMGVVTDVTSFESVQELEARAREAHGKVHVLCNNAGVGAHEDVPLWELPLSDWRWCTSVNVFGVIHGIKAFVPGMLAHGDAGHVMNTSSGNGGLMFVPSTPIYSATKAAVSGITETLHLQLSMQKAKIRAHVLYPGPHIVSSNIFTAARNRGAEFAREIPQQSELPTLETLRSMTEAAGMEFHTTSPDEVAEHAFEGLCRDSYFILPMSADGEARVRTRFEAILARRDPELAF